MRLFLFLVLIFLIYYFLKAASSALTGQPKISRGKNKKHNGHDAWDELVQDPSCGVYIPRREAIRHRVGKKEVFFCSEECKNKFLNREKGTE